jgi:hypothetical protein
MDSRRTARDFGFGTEATSSANTPSADGAGLGAASSSAMVFVGLFVFRELLL